MSFFLVTVAIIFGLSGSLPAVPHRFLAAVCGLLFLIHTAFDLRKHKISNTFILQVHILTGFLFYFILKKEISFFYHFLAKTSGFFSAFAGVMIRKPLSMGITYSGLDLVVLFLIALAATALLYNSERLVLKSCLFHAAVMAVIWIFYMAFWTVLAESSVVLGLNLLEPLTGALDYRALLFTMLLAYYMRLYGKITNEEADRRLGKAVRWTPAVLLSACVLLTALSAASAKSAVSGFSASEPGEDGVKQVVFWDSGIDFSVPEHGRYGLDYAGMFGVLPHYLNKQGYQCRIVTEISGPLLDETDVLVIFNPMYTPEDAVLSQVWDFVREGGSVLAVGDHTGHEQVRLPLNAVLEPVGISFNFDSAVPFKSLWAEEFQVNRGNSPAFHGISSRSVQIVVGASLDGGFKSKPLVVGKEGYSDLGDMENDMDGYLGDMHFGRGERIGDLVLVSEASYGAGTFMVYGDTTTFQNPIIPYSYPLIDSTFAYLSASGKQRDGTWEEDNMFAASCIIDGSHLEVISRDKSGNSVDGLFSCLMRGGFMPYFNQSESLVEMLGNRDDMALVILLEPAAAFSKEELDGLDWFMEAGGTVMLCAGYDSPNAAKELALRYGFSFDPLPIGRIAPDANSEMAFWNACPVLYQGKPPQESEDVGSLMEVWDYSTIVYKTVGSGGMYVFGDPDFLKNKNLENVDSYREGNVLFFNELLTSLLEGKG